MVVFQVFYLDDFNQKHLVVAKDAQELNFLIDRFGEIKILKICLFMNKKENESPRGIRPHRI